MPNAFSASDAGGATGVHHIGMSVADLDAALAFWESFLGAPARWRTVLDRPYLGRVVGYPGIAIRAAFVDLPGGNTLELLDYQKPGKVANVEATANPGNVHLCLAVDDAEKVWRHAVASGARPITADGPVAIDGGPNKGARAAYLRIHDGITLELFQRPPKEQPA
jgi:glyoxylase I family protein